MQSEGVLVQHLLLAARLCTAGCVLTPGGRPVLGVRASPYLVLRL